MLWKTESCKPPNVELDVAMTTDVEDRDSYPHGSTVAFSCRDEGYRLKGQSEISCRKGSWDYLPPICELGEFIVNRSVTFLQTKEK